VNALDRWRRELAGWAIPDEILATAPELPWGFPPELFRSRAERTPAEPSATIRVALDALGTGGEVLDVGVGGGATSLPLAAVATRITGVDESAGMLTRSPSSGAASASRRIATASSRRRSAGGLWNGTGSGRRDPSSTRSSRCGGTTARRDGPPAGTA
jgi:SAM-dependent methyltransferase